MNLLLTMAGTYSRFKKEGYNIPKYLLPWKHHTILTEILFQMRDLGNIFLIANERDHAFGGHLLKTLDFYDMPKSNLIWIKDTSGQAETVMRGLDSIGPLDGPILIHNIDTILYWRNYEKIEKALTTNYHGYIDVFTSNNHEYSYVLSDNNDAVIEVAEKVLISNCATSGLYGFSSPVIYKTNYSGEIFISEIYKKMINKNYDILRGPLYNEQETLVLGTPTEYLNLSQCL